MKSIDEVLKQKQAQMAMVKRELEALELVVAMLQDEPHYGERATRPVDEPIKKGWP